VPTFDRGCPRSQRDESLRPYTRLSRPDSQPPSTWKLLSRHADITNANIFTSRKLSLKLQCTPWPEACIRFRGMTIPSRGISIYIWESTEMSLWAKTQLLCEIARVSFCLYTHVNVSSSWPRIAEALGVISGKTLSDYTTWSFEDASQMPRL
jgi:hypothetical protein